MKLNYIAFINQLTIEELFLRQILRTIKKLDSTLMNSKNDVSPQLFKDILIGRANLKMVIWI